MFDLSHHYVVLFTLLLYPLFDSYAIDGINYMHVIHYKEKRQQLLLLSTKLNSIRLDLTLFVRLEWQFLRLLHGYLLSCDFIVDG